MKQMRERVLAIGLSAAIAFSIAFTFYRIAIQGNFIETNARPAERIETQ